MAPGPGKDGMQSSIIPSSAAGRTNRAAGARTGLLGCLPGHGNAQNVVQNSGCTPGVVVIPLPGNAGRSRRYWAVGLLHPCRKTRLRRFFLMKRKRTFPLDNDFNTSHPQDPTFTAQMSKQPTNPCLSAPLQWPCASDQ